MATKRDNPYGAFNFVVALGGDQGDGAEGTIVGGFSDASGLGVDVSYSEYRNGNEKFNTVRKVPNTHKLDDVTLKRGLVGSTDLFEWLKAVRDGGHDTRNVTITLLDEARNTVATWRLRNVQPKKWPRDGGERVEAAGGGARGAAWRARRRGAGRRRGVVYDPAFAAARARAGGASDGEPARACASARPGALSRALARD